MYHTFPGEEPAYRRDRSRGVWLAVAFAATVLMASIGVTISTVNSTQADVSQMEAARVPESASIVYLLDGARNLFRLNCSWTQCESEVLIDSIEEPRDLAVAEGFAYWAERSRVRRMNLATRHTETVIGGVAATALAVVADTLYFVEATSNSTFGIYSRHGRSKPQLLYDIPDKTPVSIAVDGDELWWISNSASVDESVGYLTGQMSSGPIDGSADFTTYLRVLPSPRDGAKRASSQHKLYMVCSKELEMQIVSVDLAAARAEVSYDKSDFVSIVPKMPAPKTKSDFYPKVALSSHEDAIWFTSGTTLLVQPLENGLPVGSVRVPAVKPDLLLTNPANLVVL